MVSFFGDYDTTETVHIPFNTFSSDDPSASVTVTDLVAGDIEIHKDGAVAQRTDDTGVTISIDFDGQAGNHVAHIDLSDNTHAGFYAAGSRYMVRVQGVTIDGATVNAWIGAFSIGCVLRPTTAGRKLDVSATGEGGMDWANVGSPTTTVELTNTTVGITTTNSDMRGTDSAALASVLGALADAAAAGEVTEADTLMQYIKQLINILIGGTGVVAFPAEGAPGNGVSLAEVIRAIHVDVTGLNGDAMRGTDSAALASVLGALADAAAAGEVTEADTLMKYVKQLINILIGATGIVAFPAEAPPANGVSLAEVIRAIALDVTGLAGEGMRGTDDANKTVPDAAGVAPTAVEIQTEMEGNGTSILDTLRDDLADGGRLDLLIDAIKAKTDNLPGNFPKNVALSNFVFVMIDSTDHITPKTGLTVTAQIGKDGGALASATNSVTEISNGAYKINWTQAEMNADVILLRLSSTGADDRLIIIKTDS